MSAVVVYVYAGIFFIDGVLVVAMLQLCRYWCIVTVVSLLVHCYSCVISGALLQLCH